MTQKLTAALENLPVVFLRLCEHAAYVCEGNTNLFKWNVFRLKTVFVSHVYPFKLEDVSPTTRPLPFGKILIAEPEILQVSAFPMNCTDGQSCNPPATLR